MDNANDTAFSLTVKNLQDLVESRERPEEFDATYERLGKLDGLCRALQTDKHGGIDTKSLEARRAHFGANVMPAKEPQSYLALVWECLHDETLILLCISACVSLGLGLGFEDPSTGWIEGVAIIVSVLVVVNVTASNDYVKERQFLKLNATLEDEDVNVLRSGKALTVKMQELVVGDVVVLNVGDNLNADGIVVVANSLKADESSQTGEPDLVPKTAEAPVLLSGTKIMEGTGKMVVVAVGRYSQAGIIKHLILHGREEKKAKTETPAPTTTPDVEAGAAGTATPAAGAEKTPADKKPEQKKEEEEEDEEPTGRSVLAAKLDKLAMQIGKVGLIIAVVCVVVMLIKHFVHIWGPDGRGWKWNQDPSEVLSFIIIGITILVVAIPEGLPLAVTLSLAFSGRRMQADNNLVKHLDACETMGSATTICSDKTGTLTTNRMTVMDGHGLGLKIAPIPANLPAEYVRALSEAVSLNSAETSYVSREEGVWKYNGNPTECALLKWITEAGQDFQAIRDDPRFRFEQPLKVFPFSSLRKRSSVVVPIDSASWSFSGTGVSDYKPGQSPSYRVFSKGACERVILACDRMLSQGPDGIVIRPLSDSEKTRLQNDFVEKYAEDGLRTIGIAYKDLTREEAPNVEHLDSEVAEENLILLGFVGIEDPVRPEVPGAISQCRKSGIAVIMVTGDHIKTARSIAHKCGILPKDDHVYKAMLGSEFRARVLRPDDSINQEEFDQIWPTLRVLARSTPSDKFALVRGLQNSNLFEVMRKNPSSLPAPIYPDRQVVAVTGDGTNDAPALSRSDVGFAMGIQGTSVAKTACDIVLLDDNFSSIVQAVKWGRNVYDSVSKFLQFQMTVNVAAVILAAVAALWLNDSPLRAVQLLWVNLIMDSFASLALATEPPTNALLDRKPYGRNKPIISKHMWVHLLGHAVYQLVIVFYLLIAGAEAMGIEDGRGKGHYDPPTQHFTVIFNAFVCMQVFNELNARKLYGEWNVFEGIFNNWIFVTIVVGTLGIQALIVQFSGRAIYCAPLTGEQWLICILLGVGELPWQQVINVFVRVIPASWLHDKEFADEPEPPIAHTVSHGSARDRRPSQDFPARATSRRQSNDAMIEPHTSHGQREMEMQARQIAVQRHQGHARTEVIPADSGV